MSENVDRRVLAGFRCVDAITGRTVLESLSVDAAPLAVRRNNSGIFAVVDGPKMTQATLQFLAPPAASWPPTTKFPIAIQDPGFSYLPRRATIGVPQPLPGSAATPDGVPPLPTPQDILLFPTPAALISPNWAVVRVSVVSNASTPAPLPWAVIQVQLTGNPPAQGLTDSNGEALLAVKGLGLTLSSSGSGSVTETTTAATVAAWFDPSSLKQRPGWVSNPDDILGNLSSTQWKKASQSVQLGPGQTVFVTLTISL